MTSSVHNSSSQNPQSYSNTLVDRNKRLIAPDLARGLVLLGIAIANAITTFAVLKVSPPDAVVTAAGNIYNDSIADKISVMFGTMFIHVRGLPMFATLLGYGIGMIFVREWRKGATAKQVQSTLVRRYSILIAFGLVHLIFLFWGDIMLLYGLIALTLTLLIKVSDKTLFYIALGLYCVGAAVAFLTSYFVPELFLVRNGYGSGYVRDQLFQGLLIATAIPITFFAFVPVIGPIVFIGFIAGRREVFVNPEPYQKYMRIAAALTVLVVVGIGIPWGLAELGIIPNSIFWQSFNQAFGFLSGPGYLVWLYWFGKWIEKHKWRESLPVRMITSLGRMSMSGYVMQSVLFTVLVLPYGLGFGAEKGAFEVTLIAAGIWAITVVLAWAWSLTGQRGPLETLFRKAAYSTNPANNRRVSPPTPAVSQIETQSAQPGSGMGETPVRGQEPTSGPSDDGAFRRPDAH
ncbi:MAG: DUF418 domain-containing protein [Corynebacterium sp.]|uniref:DUF418 domain-containing protein n=1 Tax=Corynebacterium sp. TaxID=1720 RepID=UPI0026DBB5D8|nr:DUF418 domain-containing protein [Corynebacterium sp.]MDO5099152.1 DUF418 domain-containing protein [Corynebacterium sp.]